MFDAHARDVATVFASHTVVAVDGADTIAALEQALETRDLIGQAKGVLMGTHAIDAAQALELLLRYSQGADLKLSEVAARLVAVTAHRTWSSPSAAGRADGFAQGGEPIEVARSSSGAPLVAGCAVSGVRGRSAEVSRTASAGFGADVGRSTIGVQRHGMAFVATRAVTPAYS